MCVELVTTLRYCRDACATRKKEGSDGKEAEKKPMKGALITDEFNSMHPPLVIVRRCSAPHISLINPPRSLRWCVPVVQPAMQL